MKIIFIFKYFVQYLNFLFVLEFLLVVLWFNYYNTFDQMNWYKNWSTELIIFTLAVRNNSIEFKRNYFFIWLNRNLKKSDFSNVYLVNTNINCVLFEIDQDLMFRWEKEMRWEWSRSLLEITVWWKGVHTKFCQAQWTSRRLYIHRIVLLLLWNEM